MNRKDFIRRTSTLLASTLVVPALASTSKDRFVSSPTIKLKKGISYYMIKDDLSVLDKFKLVKDLGFHGIEINSPAVLNTKELLGARDATGIEILGTVNKDHWSQPLSSPDEQIRKGIIDSVAKSLEETKRLGGGTVLVVPAVVNASVSYESAYMRALESIRQLIPYAEKYQVKIALENVWNNFILSPVEAKRFIDEINHPLVGWYFDVGNVLRYGWPEHWIEALDHRIFNVHIKEFSRKVMNEQGLGKGFGVPLTEGDIDWKVVMEALKKVNYSGEWLVLELGNGDRAQLQDFSTRLDKIISFNK
ncbi:sugar phosphate isomerase/epimerase family protein [Sphingobacterium bovistauri]|uniref:Sugar phosphate isomerase/epimerase n=1 Tax=Sphingobacterium bovistauri TaxID=2781959 RepID=A0ABS7Z6I9_9SPHI|nr:sugar phosphate isomerase/epimerase family protein [Sphingobacterium bovistauri]MCA5005767.1 sugar phosphate isomerase/epimerase [Sphingobacterium bovistauri]